MKTYSIENNFLKVSFLNYGASIYKFIVKELNTNIVLTNNNLIDYKKPSKGYLGLTIGPVTNRISNGHLEVYNKVLKLGTDDNGVTLHSSFKGFWNKTFEVITHKKDFIIFKLRSSKKEDGFFGNKKLLVIYKIMDSTLRIEYELISDAKTTINLTNHSYFNLNGFNSILNHELEISANEYLKVDSKQLPVGFESVSNTIFDFRKSKLLSSLDKDFSLDHHFKFHDQNKVILKNDKMSLTLTTNYPGLQVYTSSNASGQLLDNGQKFVNYSGIAFEPQYEIDALNSNLRDITLEANKIYTKWIEYEVDVK